MTRVAAPLTVLLFSAGHASAQDAMLGWFSALAARASATKRSTR